MKVYRYKGPAGTVEIQPPLAVRLVKSSWFLSLWTLGFVIWGGYYLSFSEPRVFLSTPLSADHKQIGDDCLACHVPFVGVPDDSCVSAECHQSIHRNTIHNTREERCINCHPSHTGGELTPASMSNEECARCHDELDKNPESIFHPDNQKSRKVTYVPRSIFRHRSHQFPPHYKCWQCHCTGDSTLDVKMQDLFKMDSCLKCHVRETCQVCHRYHQDREARPRDKTCINEQFVPDLLFKTMGCTAYRGREPNFKDLTVCETGQIAVEYGKELREEAAKESIFGMPASPAQGDTADGAEESAGE